MPELRRGPVVSTGRELALVSARVGFERVPHFLYFDSVERHGHSLRRGSFHILVGNSVIQSHDLVRLRKSQPYDVLIKPLDLGVPQLNGLLSSLFSLLFPQALDRVDGYALQALGKGCLDLDIICLELFNPFGNRKNIFEDLGLAK